MFSFTDATLLDVVIAARHPGVKGSCDAKPHLRHSPILE
jgi:hypothetical protein